MASFGRWLERQMDREDLNLTGLAAKLGLSHTSVRAWIIGKAEPSAENIPRLARAARARASRLFSRERRAMNEKQLTVTTGPSYNPVKQQVVLNGVQASEKLTRNMARRAVHVAAGFSYPATVWDNEHNYGYRVYANSARKIAAEE